MFGTFVALKVLVKILEVVEVTEHEGIVGWDDAALLFQFINIP